MKEHVGQRWPPVSKICKTNPEPLEKIDRNVKNDTSEAESLAAQPSMDAACEYKGKSKLIIKILINILQLEKKEEVGSGKYKHKCIMIA